MTKVKSYVIQIEQLTSVQNSILESNTVIDEITEAIFIHQLKAVTFQRTEKS